MLSQLQQIASLSLLTYPLFWVQSFDSKLKMRLYSHDRLDNSQSQLINDDPPSLFSASAFVWALGLAVLVQYSEQGCSLCSSKFTSAEGVFGVLAIAVCGKCLFGSLAMEKHKRGYLDGKGKLVRPVSWRLLDFLTSIPVNVLDTGVNKLFWFFIISALLWILHKVGWWTDSEKLVIPAYVFVSCAFLHFGRIAGVHIHSKNVSFFAATGLPHRKPWNGFTRLSIWLICGTSFFVTYSALEISLKNCGAAQNVLPSFKLLLVSLLAIPICNLIAGILAAIPAYVLAIRR